ncbi:hypothetical protein [Nonomuraea basaltis]|uniref:hypothetical protein n=1 Tax=Nonomuraea basaltis TaxID=2495887 RepID=UPI001486F6AE|nr:hypothetical protein [Nonomuraea basaltis]TMR95406.1 hypothetical protein EJK15_28910 [Nonomuraea basaltis]
MLQPARTPTGRADDGVESAAHLRSRFGDIESYGTLIRVRSAGADIVTADWTRDAFLPHEWPQHADHDGM